jgi:peptide/nickel transport system substrate-binding protein
MLPDPRAAPSKEESAVKLRTGAVVASSVALALVIAACSSKSATPGNTASGGPAGASGFNAASTGIVNPSTHKGGVLKLGQASDFDSLDPARTYYAYGWNFTRYYNRTLVTSTPAPGKDALKLTNDLASSQNISPDGLTYTYKLKSGIKFEDGTPITSKDIKYGIERVFATDVISGGPTYLITFLDQGQKYPGPYKDTDPNKLGLKSVTTPDDSTIVIHLDKPFADLPYLLAMPGAGPVPKDKDTGAKYGSHPVSSGPYKFKSYEPGKSLVLVRNENWDPATDSVRKALPDEIDVTSGLDPEELDSELMDGTQNIDIGQVGVQPTAQAKILLDPELKKNADEPLTGFTRYFAVSTVVPPLNNIECRKAVQYAADKVALQTARGGKDAGGDIAPSMIPPTVAGYDPDLTPFTGKAGTPDVAKAKAALQACGQPNGFKTVIATTNKGKGPKVAEALQQALAKVGITATIDASDQSLYYSTTIGSPANVHKKGFGLMVAGWGADFPTGYGYLDVLVDGRKIQSAGNSNYAEVNDPAINDAIDKALLETDPAKAAAAWAQIDKMAMDTGAFLPFVFDKALNYRNPKTTNVYVDAYYGMYDFQALGVEG